MGIKKRNWIPVVLYACCIFYITVLTRRASLFHEIKLVPFWSYSAWIENGFLSGRQILLNMLLFVPLGYLMGSAVRKPWLGIAICISMSFTIELLQFLFYLGTVDVDDIISNTVGASIGLLAQRKLPKKVENVIAVVFIGIGLVGCGYSELHKPIPEYSRAFAFYITEVQGEEISGCCYLYEKPDLSYQLFIGGQAAEISVENNQFTAVAKKDGEVQVAFAGHQPVPTQSYLRNGKIEYVEKVPSVDGVPEEWTAKAYNADSDTIVFQDGQKLYWLVGSELGDTGIIYHIFTNEAEKLPEKRVEYGFESRSFHSGDGSELDSISGYRVFCQGNSR